MPKPYVPWSDKTRREKAPIVAILAVGMFMAGVASCFILYVFTHRESLLEDRPGVAETPSAAEPSEPAYVVTKAQFDQLRDGMTYDQVKQLLGDPGEQIAHQNLMGLTDDMYRWTNWNGSLMMLMFQNGRMISKNQFNLP
jgi:hypothetical protein